jgi:signal transduction histidine kinase
MTVTRTLQLMAFFAFGVITSPCIYSQNTDSLRKVLATSPDDSNKVKTMLKLVESVMYDNPDSATQISQQAVSLSQNKSYLQLLPKAYNALGMANYNAGKYREAIDAFSQYFETSKKVGNKVNMGFAKNNQGNVYIELGKYDSTLLFYKEALEIRKSINDTFGIAQSYNNLGYVSKEIGDYDKAVEYMLLALRQFEKLNNLSATAITSNTIGQVYLKKSDFKQAYTYFRRAQAIFIQLKDDRNLAISLHSIGNGHLLEGHFDSTLIYYKQALALYEKQKDLRQMALMYSNLGDVKQKQGLHAEAQSFFRKAIELNRSIGNSRGLSQELISYASSLLKTQQIPMAKAALDSAGILLTGSRKKTDIRDYHQVMAEYYQATGNYESAIDEFNLFVIYKDSVLNEVNLEAIADMQAKYESEKKEQEIALQKAEVRRKNAWLFGISALTVMLILLGLSYYNRYRLRKEKELQAAVMRQQDIATKAVMEAEENERRRIATELHDGVGQMMSAAKMNLSAFETELAMTDPDKKQKMERIVSLVDESCKEVRVVSHNMMPNALLKRGLAAAVRDFIDKIDSKILQVNLYAEGLDERLEPGLESMLYRIIQECVNNVIKHSGANHLDISLVKEPEGISLTVEDNGKGFDTGRKELFEGIGLKNIISRVQFLKGTVDFDSAPGRGTLVAIHVPQQTI